MEAPGIQVLLLLLGIGVATFALVGVRSVFRRAPVRRVRAAGPGSDPPAVTDSRFAWTLEALTQTALRGGNRVEILTDGDGTYPRLWSDLRAARRSITIQVYYAKPGRMADTLRDILCQRAAAGVRVRFLGDAFGAKDLPPAYFEALRRAGVETATHRPIRWYSLHKAHHRGHTRAVVIDGAIGYTGGFGIDDKWYGDGRHEGQWRETNARFTGPAVAQLQAAFAAGWAEATGTLITGDAFFPLPAEPAVGLQTAGLMYSTPTLGSTPAERLFALAIAAARERLYLSSSYFVPTDLFCELLKAAAARGVDVRVLTASSKTDVKIAWWAGRARYEELLAAGIRIYEYQPAMMHAKTFVVDGLCTMVGALNFDNRSIVLMDETGLVVLDAPLGASMDRLFGEDLRYAREIDLETFRGRPWWNRLAERTTRLLARVL